METEVKLSFKDKESLFKFAKSDMFRGLCVNLRDVEPLLLENSYLDTTGMTISSRGAMVRVRHYSGEDLDEYEFTVKSGGNTSEGLHQRYEWNVKSDSGIFSISEFKLKSSGSDDPSELLDTVFEGISDEDLKVMCCNSFNRTVYELEISSSKIEACFDSGIIRGADPLKTEEICELELELIEGDVSDLNSLSEMFIKEADCHPLNNTKFKRTLALAMG